ncbi:MAG: outer membrane beta-barrel protein [Bacteroidaceae bacterium]|nr:outer membrane beta-barrel protein [Bacteroidaceae bacterium]
MIKRLYIIILYACACLHAGAQRISHEYRDVPLSEALRQIGDEQKTWSINFMYDELESFSITTQVRNATVPDALRQMIGFYPLRMIVREHDIYIECPVKTDRRYVGELRDERDEPIALANVSLLNPADSTLLAHGVSSEGGAFVIPCDSPRVVLRATFIGYEPITRLTEDADLGIIRMNPATEQMQGLTITGERPRFRMVDGGLSVDIEGTRLAEIGTAHDLLGQLPRVQAKANGGVEIYGLGEPVIYIGNRQIRDAEELTRLRSSAIKSVEIITSPGARYRKDANAVIRIHTLKNQGDGFSLSTTTNTRNNTRWGGYEDLTLKYRTHSMEVFAETYGRSSWMGEDNHIGAELMMPGSDLFIDQNGLTKMRSRAYWNQVGINYDITERHTVGASYTVSGSNIKDGTIGSEQTIYTGGQPTGSVWQDATVNRRRSPLHDANFYYTGRAGRLSIDFDGTYYSGCDRERDVRLEKSLELSDRDVHTQSNQHNRMAAGKLVMSHSVWMGKAELGSEVTDTHTDGTYTNNEMPQLNNETRIRETNLATFAEYKITMGQFKLAAGLRYEHASSKYSSENGAAEEPIQYRDVVDKGEASPVSTTTEDCFIRHWEKWFPNASISWESNGWSLQTAYTRKSHRPTYWQLRNFVQYDNRYTYEGGNPRLQSEQDHRLEFSLLRRWISFTAEYEYAQNAIAWFPVLNAEETYVLLCNRNIGHEQFVRTSVVASPRFGWYRPQWMLGLSHHFFDATQYGSQLSHRHPCITLSLKNSFQWKNDWTAMLDLRIVTDRYGDFQHEQHYSSLDARINKSLFRKSLMLSLYATDILRTSKERWVTYGLGTNLTKDCYNYDRTLGFTLTYNLNTAQSKYRGRGAGNDEKGRL